MQPRKHFCARCQKSYGTVQAKKRHISDSLKAPSLRPLLSPTDSPTKEELNEHLEYDHSVCRLVIANLKHLASLFTHILR
ncbi:hypothetical protein BDW66DRAFT_140777 [Aspergillus desertorum]